MNTKQICQSCSMPLEQTELQGTEKDGSKSLEYCTYCYGNGSFINPGMTLDEMKVIVKEQMVKRNIDETIIDTAINILPGLKRWKSTNIPLN